MSRRSFLIGHLTGLLLGSALMFVCLSLQPKPQPPATPVLFTPAKFTAPAAPSPETPPHWKEFEFNGRPVYIIPLEKNDSPKLRTL